MAAPAATDQTPTRDRVAFLWSPILPPPFSRAAAQATRIRPSFPASNRQYWHTGPPCGQRSWAPERSRHPDWLWSFRSHSNRFSDSPAISPWDSGQMVGACSRTVSACKVLGIASWRVEQVMTAVPGWLPSRFRRSGSHPARQGCAGTDSSRGEIPVSSVRVRGHANDPQWAW